MTTSQHKLCKPQCNQLRRTYANPAAFSQAHNPNDMKTHTITAERRITFQPAENDSQSGQPQFNAEDKGNETVLVVDDEPLVRQMIAYLLQESGYRVLEASDSLEAQRLAGANEKIHLLVTDFCMPETNGLQLARWFQSRYPDTKVLIATGSLWEFVSQVGDHERFAVLAKPFDGVQLSRMVRLILDEPKPRHSGNKPMYQRPK